MAGAMTSGDRPLIDPIEQAIIDYVGAEIHGPEDCQAARDHWGQQFKGPERAMYLDVLEARLEQRLRELDGLRDLGGAVTTHRQFPVLP